MIESVEDWIIQGCTFISGLIAVRVYIWNIEDPI
jgi:hypothetical protein